MLKRIILSIALACQLIPQSALATPAPQVATQPQQKQHTCKYIVHAACSACDCLGCESNHSQTCSHTWVCAQCNKPSALDQSDIKQLSYSRNGQEIMMAKNEISIHTQAIQSIKDDSSLTYEDARRIAKQKNIDQWKQRAAQDKTNAQTAQQATYYIGMTKLGAACVIIGVHCYYGYHGEPLPWWAKLVTDIATVIAK